MAVETGRAVFVPGAEALADQMNLTVAGTIPQFTDATQRAALWPSPPAGALSIDQTQYRLEIYTGSTWRNLLAVMNSSNAEVRARYLRHSTALLETYPSGCFLELNSGSAYLTWRPTAGSSLQRRVIHTSVVDGDLVIRTTRTTTTGSISRRRKRCYRIRFRSRAARSGSRSPGISPPSRWRGISAYRATRARKATCTTASTRHARPGRNSSSPGT